MSSYLLDTSVYIWMATGDSRVSQIKEIQHGSFFVSVVSFWEMSIKLGLGKLKLEIPAKDLLQDPTDKGIQLVDLSLNDTIEYARLPFPESGHRDPFDRMIVVQAKSRDFTVITADVAFNAYEVSLFSL